MSCNIPPEILEYIEQVENNAPRACKEQHALVALIRRVFATEDIYVDTERMRKYFRIARYFPYDRLFRGRPLRWGFGCAPIAKMEAPGSRHCLPWSGVALERMA